MKNRRAAIITLIGLAAVVLAVVVGLVAQTAKAEDGDATVDVMVQVDENGQVTGKVINPPLVFIKGASTAGVPNGGRVHWNFTANRLVGSLVLKVIFDFPEGSPFTGWIGQANGVGLNPIAPPVVLDSAKTDKTCGVYRYRIEIKQGDRVIDPEAEVQITCPAGGISELITDAGHPSSATSFGDSEAHAALAAGIAAALLTLGAGGWYARRRFVRR
jgi:hypothetical protein